MLGQLINTTNKSEGNLPFVAKSIETQATVDQNGPVIEPFIWSIHRNDGFRSSPASKQQF